MKSEPSSGFRAGGIAACLVFALLVAGGTGAGSASGSPNKAATSSSRTTDRPAERQVILLGLRRRGKPQVFAAKVSSPSSPRYREFLTTAQYRKRFSARGADQRRVRRFLASRRGVFNVRMNSSHTTVLAVVTPKMARLFCVNPSKKSPARLCRPKRLRRAVRQVSAGDVYQPVRKRSSPVSRQPAGTNTGTPKGCKAALKSKAFTPNQLSTAYGADALHSRGLDGSGVRVATLSSQRVDPASFKTWAGCFGLPTPKVRQFAMPGATPETGTAPEETVLDVEALAMLAPGLDRITPIYVPLVQGFDNSFLLFMFGALDPSRQGGKLPQILSISDGVCEDRFTKAELMLGQRMLAEAAAKGITTLAASGDLGFRGCFTSSRGALFPGSSRFATSVGGTDLSLTKDNRIGKQVVWSTFGSDPRQGVGTGGGPSDEWNRPAFQTGPGIGPPLQHGKPTRLSPDIASMASFTPGLTTFDKDDGGWGIGGGTSAATPLTAAIVALVLEQEEKSSRPALGSITPLLYKMARGANYGSIFSDITVGTSSSKPGTAAGRSPAGGAAQPGYDLATGWGSLKAGAFADAVAALTDPP